MPAAVARRTTSPLWAAVLLAAVLVGAKAILLGKPDSWRWPLILMIASFKDLLFALSVGTVGEVAMRLASRRPKIARAVRVTMLAFCTVCVAYTVIAVGVFEYFDRPLTYDLLRLVGSARAVRSSVTERVTLGKVVSIVLLPAVFVATAHWAGRRRRVVLSGGTLMCVSAVLGLWLYTTRWDDLPSRHLAPNPHVELFRSTVVGLFGAPRPTFPNDFPSEDKLEFRTVGARGSGTPATGAFEPPAGINRPRNVIVIVLESVGTQYLSLYGSAYDTTPNLVAESEHALVFDNFYSHLGYTFCSFMAINFSVYPGLPWRYLPKEGVELPPTLASAQRARGRDTVYLCNGDMDWEGLRYMTEGRGYDEVHDYREFNCPALSSWGAEDRYLIDRLIQWIDQRGPSAPGFHAVCWTDQTHDPHATSPGVPLVDFFRGKRPAGHADDLARYLNVLRETDRHLGRLFAALRERGLADDTLVVITGDHGEAFGDPHEARGHGFSLYQEDVNVPLMIWNPRLFSPGRRVATVGAHVDLNPTIADVLGVEPPGAWQGHSLFDSERPSRAFFIVSIGEYLFGVREGQWKYILNATGGQEMLFDLGRDPQERNNQAAADPARCRRFKQRIAAWVSFEEEFLCGRTD